MNKRSNHIAISAEESEECSRRLVSQLKTNRSKVKILAFFFSEASPTYLRTRTRRGENLVIGIAYFKICDIIVLVLNLVFTGACI